MLIFYVSINYIYTLYIKYVYYPTYDPSSGGLLILLKTSRCCGKNGSCTTSVVGLRLVCSAFMTVMNSLVENSLVACRIVDRKYLGRFLENSF